MDFPKNLKIHHPKSAFSLRKTRVKLKADVIFYKCRSSGTNPMKLYEPSEEPKNPEVHFIAGLKSENAILIKLAKGMQQTRLHSLGMIQMLHLLHKLRLPGDVKIIHARLHAGFHHRRAVLPIRPHAAHNQLSLLAKINKRGHAGDIRFEDGNGEVLELVAASGGPRQRCSELLLGAAGDGDAARGGIGTGGGEFEELAEDVLAREAGRAQNHDVHQLLRHGGEYSQTDRGIVWRRVGMARKLLHEEQEKLIFD